MSAPVAKRNGCRVGSVALANWIHVEAARIQAARRP